MSNQKTVVVGMSGGVDSSVSALLLKEQGYRVIGLFMKNWEEVNEEGVCQSAEDYSDVCQVCSALDIPYYTVNFSNEYKQRVFAEFIEELKQGRTPNPDILCNKEIKFNLFLSKALELGADYLATGHYCQIGLQDGQFILKKGEDPNKDQSYFLYTLNSSILEKVLFPIGHLHKSEVRQLASKFGLKTAQKKDSVGICFIGKRDFSQFLSQYLPYQAGDFETLDGKKVGRHQGIAFYTLGQRRGLRIGGSGDAWFVVGKDLNRKVVFVAQGATHPSLYSSELKATQLSWVTNPPLSFPFNCLAKIRYRQEEQACQIQSIENGILQVKFCVPQRAITSGQSIVFYKDSICLGGGVIQ